MKLCLSLRIALLLCLVGWTVDGQQAKPQNTASTVTVVSGEKMAVVARCESANGRPAAQISWVTTAGGNATTVSKAGGDNTVTVTSEYKLVPRATDNGKDISCVVSHRTLTKPKRFKMKLAVEFSQSPTLKVMISSNEDVEKEHKATFSCFASLFSPPVHEITWQRNGQEILSGSDVKTSSFEAERNANGTLYNAISHLQVKDTDWMDGHPTITCVFQGSGGNVSKSVTHDANEQRRNCDNPDENLMKMEILPPSIEELFYNKKTLLVCEVLELVATVDAVTWQDKDGTTLPNAQNKTSLRGGKRLFRVAVEVFYEEWNKGIHYYCVAEHKSLLFAKEMTFERSNGGLFKRPSVFLLPPVEQTSQHMVTLVCYVRDFYPREVAVSWLINDEPVETESSDYAFNTTNLMENKGVFSVYGQLTFSDALWRKTEAMYSCVVYHESMINTTRIIVRSMVERTADKP